MRRSVSPKLLISLSFAAIGTLIAGPAVAGGTGNGTAGSGQARHGDGADVPQYRYEADAQRLCKGDTVVWGSSNQPGVFYAAGAGPERVGGFYACLAQARKAGYQIVGS
jgi:hypothetical protein